MELSLAITGNKLLAYRGIQSIAVPPRETTTGTEKLNLGAVG
jgi:hypothetical protein